MIRSRDRNPRPARRCPPESSNSPARPSTSSPTPTTPAGPPPRRSPRAIRRGQQARARAALGLATGNTPVPVYERLVAMHKAGELSFSGSRPTTSTSITRSRPADPRSYRSYMDRHLFRHVDLAPNRTHVLDGTVPEAFVAEHAALFDRMIAAEGGLDFQLLGIGRNGHIGFNEPTQMPVDEALGLPTRLVVLHPVTLADAAGEFGAAASVPLRALTLGVAPILAARSILVLAFGERKAEPLARALTGPDDGRAPRQPAPARGRPGDVDGRRGRGRGARVRGAAMLTVYHLRRLDPRLLPLQRPPRRPRRPARRQPRRPLPRVPRPRPDDRGSATSGSIGGPSTGRRSTTCPARPRGLRVEGPALALVTIGGNDLLRGLVDDDRPRGRRVRPQADGLPRRPADPPRRARHGLRPDLRRRRRGRRHLPRPDPGPRQLRPDERGARRARPEVRRPRRHPRPFPHRAGPTGS